MNLNLGFVYKNNKLINHRSALKIILNPILRMFGREIATEVRLTPFLKKYIIIKYKLVKTDVQLNLFKNYKESIIYKLKKDEIIEKRDSLL